MHSIQSKKIRAKKRHPHLEKWRKSLRQSLLNPAISEQQREAVKRRLQEIANGKDYCCEERVVSLGAIESDAPPWGTGTKKSKK
tara:strand:- start:3402 stop:3653 length:252 start_codon:yes stop_codon:yes gene_type:complete